MRDDTSTHFAPAARATAAEIEELIDSASSNQVIDTLLRYVNGLLAVLDEHRQIVAVNDAYLRFLGIEDAGQALGLRPGEAVECVHAHEMPGGCGTSKHCASCGAAIAIVTTLVENRPVERECALEARRDGTTVSLDLKVSAVPFEMQGRRFVLLYLDDVTEARRRACLERAFLHDMNNVIFGLSGMTSILIDASKEKREELAPHIQHLANRLLSEVQLQRILAHDESGRIPVSCNNLLVSDVVEELEQLFIHHPATEGKTLKRGNLDGKPRLETDRALLVRVLCNMFVNAFEATDTGGEVRLDVTATAEQITFRVQSAAEIPGRIAQRVFQRYFTTKTGMGRGQGTYIMKLLGEKYLAGSVGFETSPEGTTFHITLPVRAPHAQK